MRTDPIPPREIEDEEIHPILDNLILTLKRAQIPYLFGGGLAAKCLGRERRTKDIDLFVRPEHADPLLEALERGGFETEKTDPRWLYKAQKENAPIDIIFKSAGDIFLDEETFRRATPIEFMGMAINILKSAKIDWDYLKRRAKHGPRRNGGRATQTGPPLPSGRL